MTAWKWRMQPEVLQWIDLPEAVVLSLVNLGEHVSARLEGWMREA